MLRIPCNKLDLSEVQIILTCTKKRCKRHFLVLAAATFWRAPNSSSFESLEGYVPFKFPDVAIITCDFSHNHGYFSQKVMIFLPFVSTCSATQRKNASMLFGLTARGGMLGEKVDKTSKASRASSGNKNEYLVIGPVGWNQNPLTYTYLVTHRGCNICFNHIYIYSCWGL